jgi:glycogen operon protein
VALDCPDWSEHSRSLAFTLRSVAGRFLLHGMLNAYWEPLTFELPKTPREGEGSWRRCIDTALASPNDIHRWRDAPLLTEATYRVEPRSMVVLASVLPPLPSPA